MVLPKSTPCSFLIAATLSVTILGAQAAQPQRDPDVPFVPTKNTDVVYDLGCGDGRIVIAAAKNFGARGVGIDIDPERIREVQANANTAGVNDLVACRSGIVTTYAMGDI